MKYIFQFIFTIVVPLSCYGQSWMEITQKALTSNYKKDSLFLYIEKGYEKAIESGNIEHQFFSLRIGSNQAYELFEISQMRNYVVRYEALLKQHDVKHLKDYIVLEKYKGFAAYHFMVGNHEKSLKYLDSLDTYKETKPLEERDFFTHRIENVANTFRIKNLRNQGKLSEAIRLLTKYAYENSFEERSLSQDQQLFELKYKRELASILAQKKNYKKSIALFKEIQATTKQWNYHSKFVEGLKILTAETYLKLGKIDEAEKQLSNVGSKFLRNI